MKAPPFSRHVHRLPRKVTIGLSAGWLVIAIKCLRAPGLMARWQVPVNPAWVIVPTLIFAALVTALVLTHDWSDEDAGH